MKKNCFVKKSTKAKKILNCISCNNFKRKCKYKHFIVKIKICFFSLMYFVLLGVNYLIHTCLIPLLFSFPWFFEPSDKLLQIPLCSLYRRIFQAFVIFFICCSILTNFRLCMPKKIHKLSISWLNIGNCAYFIHS